MNSKKKKIRDRIPRKVLNREIRQVAAAKILSLSERQIRRLVQTLRDDSKSVKHSKVDKSESKDLDVQQNDIAIVGMSCRFPGARNYHEFWQNLIDGKNSISEIPLDRWDWRDYWGDPQIETNKTNVKWGGFVDDVDKFDAHFFAISPREAELMDPQQRIMLELTWECFEDAGIIPSSVTGQKVGVFIGVCNYDYKELQDRCNHSITGHCLTGTA